MLSVGYLYDPDAQATLNARGENYWFAYIQEVFGQMGASAKPIHRVEVDSLDQLPQSLRVLVVGDARSADLSGTHDKIERWLKSGGTLIGLAPEGLDALFGNARHSVTPEAHSPFQPTGLMQFSRHRLTTGVYSPFYRKQPLPVFGPVRKVVPQKSKPLARLLNIREAESGFPAVTHLRVGKGHAFYFAFDLAQTMWVLHKGRPVDGDYDLDGYLRLSDGMVTGNLPQDVPYADMLLFLLQNVLHQARIPMVHQIPPSRDGVADMLLFFGGDDEGASDGLQVEASQFMKSRGLPYHINIMPRPDGTFGLSRQDHDRVVANGHEASLHYNFIDGFQHPVGFTHEDVARQWEWFCRAFGHAPVATVTHWCRWCGWNEPAKWMRDVGGRADNSRIGVSSPPLNPVNTIGYAFGTAFPNYFYEDWRGENRRIDFLSEPILAYEVGYSGESTDFGTLHRAVDLAAHYHLTANFFYHPIYIARYPGCQKAIDELLRYTEERGQRPAYFGPDSLWEWWDARSRCHVDNVTVSAKEIRLAARCDYREGMVVKVPVEGAVAQVTVGSQSVPPVLQEHCGLSYAMVVCPPGENEVRVTLA